MYADGLGVRKNYGTAVKWWTLGAEQGQLSCCCFLGKMYKNGWGVRKNYVEAYKFISIGAEDGDWKDFVEEMTEELEGMMTKAEISRAKRQARNYQKKTISWPLR